MCSILLLLTAIFREMYIIYLDLCLLSPEHADLNENVLDNV